MTNTRFLKDAKNIVEIREIWHSTKDKKSILGIYGNSQVITHVITKIDSMVSNLSYFNTFYGYTRLIKACEMVFELHKKPLNVCEQTINVLYKNF